MISVRPTNWHLRRAASAKGDDSLVSSHCTDCESELLWIGSTLHEDILLIFNASAGSHCTLGVTSNNKTCISFTKNCLLFLLFWWWLFHLVLLGQLDVTKCDYSHNHLFPSVLADSQGQLWDTQSSFRALNYSFFSVF